MGKVTGGKERGDVSEAEAVAVPVKVKNAAKNDEKKVEMTPIRRARNNQSLKVPEKVVKAP